MSRLLFATLVTAAFLFGNIHAVTAQQAKTDDLRSESTTQPEYVLEVHTPEGCLFSPIMGKKKMAVVLYALGRPGRYLPDNYGQPIVSQVMFTAKQAGDLWSITTNVGLGEFYDAGDEQAGAVMLATNQRSEVELSRFGLRQFRVGVLRIMDQKLSQPMVRNLAPSLSVEKLESKRFPDDFRLSLKNLSAKDVSAIQYNTIKGQRLLFLKWMGSDPAKSLIKAGETYQLDVLSEDKTCGESDGYYPNQADRIDLVSVVFTDGSYEGESALPALIRGSAYGNRQQLERVASALDSWSGDALTNPAQLSVYFKNLSDTLNETPEPGILESLLEGLPPQDSDAQFTINNFVRSGMHQVRVSLLRDSQNLESVAKTQPPERAKVFCARVIERYRAWLAGARSMTGR
ncbi:MAG TPA: hypothetical protein VKB46_12245 [Pyrinomonadaceae bacterium]|nr:hypothetical protein [Pyrinomonadaceae bacterium]